MMVSMPSDDGATQPIMCIIVDLPAPFGHRRRQAGRRTQECAIYLQGHRKSRTKSATFAQEAKKGVYTAFARRYINAQMPVDYRTQWSRMLGDRALVWHFGKNSTVLDSALAGQHANSHHLHKLRALEELLRAPRSMCAQSLRISSTACSCNSGQARWCFRPAMPSKRNRRSGGCLTRNSPDVRRRALLRTRRCGQRWIPERLDRHLCPRTHSVRSSPGSVARADAGRS